MNLGRGPLVERWNGTRWSSQSTPVPADSNPWLQGVSCPTRDSCTAVGSYAFEDHPAIVEHWDGHGWSIQPSPNVPNPLGAPVLPAMLWGVSCMSASTCTAVGQGWGTLAERNTGSGWSIQPSPNPVGGVFVVLESVSCPTATECIAVGKPGPGGGPLVERWNGRTWSMQRVPIPGGDAASMLTSVSCPTATACTAIGTWRRGMLAERWNGKRWSIQPSPHPSTVDTYQSATISCPSPTTCIAVMSAYDHHLRKTTIIERWRGPRH
jgi:hypothetical protein